MNNIPNDNVHLNEILAGIQSTTFS